MFRNGRDVAVFAAGVGIGLAATLLLSPRTGRQNRDALTELGRRGLDQSRAGIGNSLLRLRDRRHGGELGTADPAENVLTEGDLPGDEEVYERR